MTTIKNIQISNGIIEDDRKPQKLDNNKKPSKPQKEKKKDKKSGIAALTVPELKERLKDLGLSQKGKKPNSLTVSPLLSHRPHLLLLPP
jgi:hypothetical protein